MRIFSLLAPTLCLVLLLSALSAIAEEYNSFGNDWRSPSYESSSADVPSYTPRLNSSSDKDIDDSTSSSSGFRAYTPPTYKLLRTPRLVETPKLGEPNPQRNQPLVQTERRVLNPIVPRPQADDPSTNQNRLHKLDAEKEDPPGHYLGNLSKNKLDPSSTSNPIGAGSSLRSESINNPIGPYGSSISNRSANNPLATNAPRLYDSQGNYRGRISNNSLDPDSTSNPIGRYGSPISPDSINNPIGAGSPFRQDSPNNPLGTGLRIYGEK